MDKVPDEEAIVSDFLLFKAFLTDGLLADLATQDLGADEVLAGQSQLHLIQDEVYLLLVL